MTNREAYYEFQLLLNKSASNKSVNISHANYVMLFNREVKLFIKDFLRKKNSGEEINDINDFLSTITLKSKKPQNRFTPHTLPKNFLDFVSSESLVSTDTCENKVINYLYKPKDIKFPYSMYSDIRFEENICNIENGELMVYSEHFNIKNTILKYYKFIEIDIEGYVHIDDGSASVDIHPACSDLNVGRINDRVVLEVMRQFENANGFKLAQERINN